MKRTVEQTAALPKLVSLEEWENAHERLLLRNLAVYHEMFASEREAGRDALLLKYTLNRHGGAA